MAGIVSFIREGFRELGRKIGRMKLRRELAKTDRERRQALTALGQKAWEERTGLSAFPEIVEEIGRLAGRAGELSAAAERLGAEKSGLEARRQAEADRLDGERRAVEEEKKPVEAKLREAERRKAEVDGRLKKVESRRNEIQGELAALERQPQAEGSAAAGVKEKADRLRAEGESLAGEVPSLKTELEALGAEIGPLAQEAKRFAGEIARVEAEKKAALSQIDAELSRVRNELRAATSESAAVGKEQTDLFEKLGLGIYDRGGIDPGLAEAAGAVSEIDRARAETQGRIEASLTETAAMPRMTMGKFWGAILGMIFLAVVAGLGVDYVRRQWGGHAAEMRTTRVQERFQVSGAGSILPQRQLLPSFAADELVTEGGRHRTVKVFVTEEALRSEGEEDGQPFIIIVRLDKNLVWVLSPDKKTYTETPMSFGERSASLRQHSGEPGCSVVGEEKVGEYLCVKEQCRVTIGGKSHSETRWVAKDLGGLVIKHTDGIQTFQFGAIKVGPQAPALFQIPDGYRKSSE